MSDEHEAGTAARPTSPWHVGQLSPLMGAGVWCWLVWNPRYESVSNAHIACSDRETALAIARMLNTRRQ